MNIWTELAAILALSLATFLLISATVRIVSGIGV